MFISVKPLSFHMYTLIICKKSAGSQATRSHRKGYVTEAEIAAHAQRNYGLNRNTAYMSVVDEHLRLDDGHVSERNRQVRRYGIRAARAVCISRVIGVLAVSFFCMACGRDTSLGENNPRRLVRVSTSNGEIHASP